MQTSQWRCNATGGELVHPAPSQTRMIAVVIDEVEMADWWRRFGGDEAHGGGDWEMKGEA